MQGKKRLIVTIFAIISILFGLSGAILSFIGFWELNSLREDFYNMDNIGMSVAGVIEKTARMLEKSDETFGNIADSIMSTNDTIDYASEISNDSGVAFNKIAGITDFDILGFKPFSGAKEFFNDVGNNLIGLSEELKNSHKNLKINASDIRSTGDDLEKISVELEDLSERLKRVVRSFDIYSFIIALKYIFVYFVMLNIVLILNGIMFLILR